MKKDFRKKFFLICGGIFLCLMLLSLVIWISIKPPNRTPEEALQKFYTYGDDFPNEIAAEDMLMDPLILSGEAVVPLVIREVENPKMPRRRYAIGFLGNGPYKQALPVLEKILQDLSEDEIFRGEALQAIFLIDEVRGRKYAMNYATDKTYLGECASDIIEGRVTKEFRRSYFDAYLGWHY